MLRGTKYLMMSAIFATSFTSFGAIGDAEAQSRACRVLQTQLAALDGNRGNSNRGSKEYRKYSDAIRKQQIEISKVSKIAKRNRCTSRGIFRNRNAQCARLLGSMEKMQANLAGLQQTRERFAPSQAGNSRKKRTILARMERQGCNVSRSQHTALTNERKSRRRTIIEQIFGVRTYRDSGSLAKEAYNGNAFGATYRTLCVRKTDGYYFPISFSTTHDFFDRDEQLCQAMCPGVNVGLYHHHMPGQDSENMVALGTEFPYSKEKFAFAYRKAVDNSAQCNFALREDVFASNDARSRNGALPENVYVGLPEFKTDRTFSPDDNDIALGRLSVEKIEKLLIAANEPKPDTTIVREQGDRKVRIVGPAFFPVQ